MTFEYAPNMMIVKVHPLSYFSVKKTSCIVYRVLVLLISKPQ